jgi:hypothetical protein
MDIQLLVVLLVFLFSVVYLLRRFIPFSKNRKQTGCEKCGEISLKKDIN